ncbi:hypothetical protein F4861DRAFT_538507 [Xylaria intraflava]|nr:hypothetical protein F4861DRAFT_538507 [Xylaria intraflava]
MCVVFMCICSRCHFSYPRFTECCAFRCPPLECCPRATLFRFSFVEETKCQLYPNHRSLHLGADPEEVTITMDLSADGPANEAVSRPTFVGGNSDDRVSEALATLPAASDQPEAQYGARGGKHDDDQNYGNSTSQGITNNGELTQLTEEQNLPTEYSSQPNRSSGNQTNDTNRSSDWWGNKWRKRGDRSTKKFQQDKRQRPPRSTYSTGGAQQDAPVVTNPYGTVNTTQNQCQYQYYPYQQPHYGNSVMIYGNGLNELPAGQFYVPAQGMNQYYPCQGDVNPTFPYPGSDWTQPGLVYGGGGGHILNPLATPFQTQTRLHELRKAQQLASLEQLQRSHDAAYLIHDHAGDNQNLSEGHIDNAGGKDVISDAEYNQHETSTMNENGFDAEGTGYVRHTVRRWYSDSHVLTVNKIPTISRHDAQDHENLLESDVMENDNIGMEDPSDKASKITAKDQASHGEPSDESSLPPNDKVASIKTWTSLFHTKPQLAAPGTLEPETPETKTSELKTSAAPAPETARKGDGSAPSEASKSDEYESPPAPPNSPLNPSHIPLGIISAEVLRSIWDHLSRSDVVFVGAITPPTSVSTLPIGDADSVSIISDTDSIAATDFSNRSAARREILGQTIQPALPLVRSTAVNRVPSARTTLPGQPAPVPKSPQQKKPAVAVPDVSQKPKPTLTTKPVAIPKKPVTPQPAAQGSAGAQPEVSKPPRSQPAPSQPMMPKPRLWSQVLGGSNAKSSTAIARPANPSSSKADTDWPSLGESGTQPKRKQ